LRGGVTKSLSGVVGGIDEEVGSALVSLSLSVELAGEGGSRRLRELEVLEVIPEGENWWRRSWLHVLYYRIEKIRRTSRSLLLRDQRGQEEGWMVAVWKAGTTWKVGREAEQRVCPLTGRRKADGEVMGSGGRESWSSLMQRTREGILG
jgi:hypothetical protein